MRIEDTESFWIDKAAYNNAERQFHEQIYNNKIKAQENKNPRTIVPSKKNRNRKAMAENRQDSQKTLLYLNPLTLEANYFLETLENVSRQSQLQLDPHLTHLLERIVVGIEKYLDKNPTYIMPKTRQQEQADGMTSNGVTFVSPKELVKIKRTFNCTACTHRIVGTTITKAVAHLSEQHPNPNPNGIVNIQKPVQTKQEKRRAEVEARSKMTIQLPKKVKNLVTADITNMFMERYKVADKLKVIPEYSKIEQDLCTLIAPAFPSLPVRIYKFGSRITGIGSCTSDLDIFVDIGNTFHTFENRASNETVGRLRKLSQLFSRSDKFRIINVIEQARVPIITVFHLSSSIECDICQNSLGYCNTNWLRYIFDMRPLAQYMSIYVKTWLERCKLEQISAYSMVLMVIYFLQLKNFLPSVSFLQQEESKTDQQLVGPWISSFAQISLRDLGHKKLEVTIPLIKESMREFFKFYADFNYDRYMVCPYLGKKDMFIAQFEKDMPKRYVNYIINNPNAELQIRKPMVVQDPIQLNHNVTKAVTKYALQTFVEYCAQTAELLADP